MSDVCGEWDFTGDLSLIMIQAIHAMLMTYTSRGFPSHIFKCYTVYIYIGIIK